MAIVFNPFSGNFDFSGGCSAGNTVITYANLAAFASAATAGDGALAEALDTNIVYVSDGASWLVLATPGSALTLGALDAAAATASGANLSGTNVLSMQSADATRPGLVNNTTQTISGVKTFSSAVYAAGGIDVAATGGTDTLTIGGTNADVITIGRSGGTVNILGSTQYSQVTNLQVSDLLMTLNKGGGAASAAASGIELEENSVITGYAKTSADRNSWALLAPNTAGIVTITPGAGGFTLDQGSHNPVTIGTANGLSLSTQALSMALATDSVIGAVSAVTQTFGGGKTIDGNSDEVQLTVIGHSTQTNNVMQVYTSGFTSLLTLNNSGNFAVGGTISSGAGLKISAGYFEGHNAAQATTGIYRLDNLNEIGWRNNANNGNHTIALNGSDLFAFSAGLTITGNATISGLTANRVVVSDASKILTSSATTDTEIGYVSGVTSSIQTQLNAKGVGSVTSVAASVPAFLSVSGSPITSSGTLAISYSGTALPIANGGTNSTTASSAGSVVYSTASAMAYSAVGTSGQALISGGTGAPTFYAPTAGSILFAGTSGILQQDNASLFFDDSQNFVGLGQTSPLHPLHLTKTNTIANNTDRSCIFADWTNTVSSGTTGKFSSIYGSAVASGSNNYNSIYGIRSTCTNGSTGTATNIAGYEASVTANATTAAPTTMAGIMTTIAASSANTPTKLYGSKQDITATAAGTYANTYGHHSKFTTSTSHSTTTNYFGFYADVTHNTGTITNHYGYYMPALTVAGTLTNRYAFYNADTAATNVLYGGMRYGVTALSTDTTITVAHNVITMDDSGGVKTLTLPAASATLIGQSWLIKKMSASNSTVIARAGSDTIDGATSYTLTSQYESVRVICLTATTWGIF